jgi:hypothetical protein
MRHATADPAEIQAEAHPRVQQPPGRPVQREAAWTGLFEQALADQVPQHAAQGAGVGARGRGQLGDLGEPGLHVVGDPERRDHVDAPRRAEVAQGPEVRLILSGHGRASVAGRDPIRKVCSPTR